MIMQETIKVSKIDGGGDLGTLNTEGNVLENFQVFRKYFENTMEQHQNKCGDNCIHLQRFYEKLRFDPVVQVSNRRPMAIPVSVIKQPVFNFQKT